jgi:hypothetical protein
LTYIGIGLFALFLALFIFGSVMGKNKVTKKKSAENKKTAEPTTSNTLTTSAAEILKTTANAKVVKECCECDCKEEKLRKEIVKLCDEATNQLQGAISQAKEEIEKIDAPENCSYNDMKDYMVATKRKTAPEPKEPKPKKIKMPKNTGGG